MLSDRLATAHCRLTEAIDALAAAAGPDTTPAERLSVLTMCEGAARRLDRVSVATTAGLDRDGTELPPKLPVTAARFAAGRIGLDHVHVVAAVLGSGAATPASNSDR